MPRKQTTTKNRDERLKQLEAENRRLKQIIARGSQQFRELAAAQGKRLLPRGVAVGSVTGAGSNAPRFGLRVWGEGPKESAGTPAAVPGAVRRRLQRRTA